MRGITSEYGGTTLEYAGVLLLLLLVVVVIAAIAKAVGVLTLVIALAALFAVGVLARPVARLARRRYPLFR
jgi:hypothetical protein